MVIKNLNKHDFKQKKHLPLTQTIYGKTASLLITYLFLLNMQSFSIY